MANFKIEFENIDWENNSIGAKQKLFQSDNKKVRLLRLEDNFDDIDWCKKGHIGFVLKGEMTLDFSNREENYKAGDAFIIECGESNKHRAKIKKGKFAELILVEEGSI